jgi:hypothetical protein
LSCRFPRCSRCDGNFIHEGACSFTNDKGAFKATIEPVASLGQLHVVRRLSQLHENKVSYVEFNVSSKGLVQCVVGPRQPFPNDKGFLVTINSLWSGYFTSGCSCCHDSDRSKVFHKWVDDVNKFQVVIDVPKK